MQQLEEKVKVALAYARRVISEAEDSAARVAGLPDGPNKRIETVTATSSISEARGALAALRIILPGDAELERLWVRLNHCPVVMLVGPERAEATRPQYQ